jgi:hypothetical protein
MGDVRLPTAPGFIVDPDVMGRAMTQARKICLKERKTCLKAQVQKICLKAQVQKICLKRWHGRAR